MAPKQKHKEPIVYAASVLFRRQGYAGTGLNDIVDASGAPKGSLYHYFPEGKLSIAVAAVEASGRRLAATLQELSERTENTGDLMIAYANLAAGWMKKSGFRDGCPMSTLLLELTPANRAVSEACRKAYAARISILRDKLITDGYSADRAQRLAWLCSSAIQGALLQARVARSAAPIVSAAEEIASMLTPAR